MALLLMPICATMQLTGMVPQLRGVSLDTGREEQQRPSTFE